MNYFYVTEEDQKFWIACKKVSKSKKKTLFLKCKTSVSEAYPAGENTKPVVSEAPMVEVSSRAVIIPISKASYKDVVHFAKKVRSSINRFHISTLVR